MALATWWSSPCMAAIMANIVCSVVVVTGASAALAVLALWYPASVAGVVGCRLDSALRKKVVKLASVFSPWGLLSQSSTEGNGEKAGVLDAVDSSIHCVPFADGVASGVGEGATVLDVGE